MKVLVVGTGAREHAIADALKDDVELYCYMSKINPGMSKIAEFKQGDEGEVEKVAEYAVETPVRSGGFRQHLVRKQNNSSDVLFSQTNSPGIRQTNR